MDNLRTTNLRDVGDAHHDGLFGGRAVHPVRIGPGHAVRLIKNGFVPGVDLRLPRRPQPGRRLPQLLVGLLLYGASMAMQIRAALGLNPWDVLHEGLVEQTPLSFGLITAITGAVVLLA